MGGGVWLAQWTITTPKDPGAISVPIPAPSIGWDVKHRPLGTIRQQNLKKNPELELRRLRAQVEERDKEIAALRQAAKVKDRKLDQLSNRCRKEQLRQYYRFMELEPVVELEEDSGGGEESPTSSGPPSLSPPPYVADIWAEDSLYSGLLREHLELQRSHHALEARLKRSEARARQLQQLRRTSADQLQQLQTEAMELRELNELLEFRILELEEGHDHGSSARSPGPDTRDVCTDTENDDVSDSGVVSLPTSEEMGSDTDLEVHDLKIERTHNNIPDCTATGNELSKLSSRIVATVSPFTELAPPSSPTDCQDILKEIVVRQSYSCLTKQLKNTDTMQESGIFEGDAVEWISRGTQTEGPSLSGDLSAEIQKLTQFRARVEEERSGLLAGHELEDKVRVYESSGEQQAERLQRELHLAAQVKELSAKVARLQADNSRLEEERCELEEAENDTRLRCQKLEVKLQALSERKGELQSRLQQERRTNGNLKSNLAEGDKWRREVRYLETVLSKYEQRNYELEEREMELGHRLELLEGCWPVLLLWTIWRTFTANASRVQLSLTDKPHWSTKQSEPIDKNVKYEQSVLPVSQRYYQDTYSDNISSKLRELEYDDAIGERQEAEGMSNASDTEYRFELQERTGGETIDLQRAKEIEEGYIKRIKELEEELRSIKEHKKESSIVLVSEKSSPVESYPSRISDDSSLVKCLPARSVYEEHVSDGCEELVNHDAECKRRLEELVLSETDLKSRIVELEQKETAYMETLQQADDLWSELEGGYQKQLQSLRASEAELRGRLEAAESRHRASRQSDESRVVELEQALVELQGALRRTEDDKAALTTKVATLSEALAVAEGAMERLQREVDAVLKPQIGQEKRLVADLQRDLAHKGETMESMQDSYETEIEILKCQLTAAKKECMHANCECDQLKAEVQTLEKTIQEQRECLLEQRQHNEKTLITLTSLLESKDRELEGAMLAARDAMVRSAQEELQEALLAEGESSTEPAVLIQPPPRTKRGGVGRRASLQEGRAARQDAAALLSKNGVKGTDVSRGKPNMEGKTDVRCGRKEGDTAQENRKPMWLTEVSISVNETPDARSDVKRTIMYWDDLSSHKSGGSRSRSNRVRALGRAVEGEAAI